MIEINWKDARTERPSLTITEGKKFASVEMVDCLVSDGSEVWEEMYDPTEGFNPTIKRFIEFKSIKP